MNNPMLTRLAALNAEYAAAIDDDRLEEWPGYFVEDCLYKITSADNVRDGNEAGIVYADSRSMLADRVLALRRANIYERQTYRHIVGTPRLTGADTAETPFLVVRTMRDGRMDLFVAGRYQDRFHDAAGTLRFRERIVICDSSHFDTLVAIPL
ncbi:MAG TPA: aromatic-ring-hydroxylating dioxygenase subunit beta [Rhodopila sp.]|jgi:anthranilate 1,2-dioxygenase small subunit/terephthalate 1,2-dioxygenase oxygenase component beta subunit|nr:aromatic-ring-hydroxylating dioxygenase subunit beta [Rhodopila sp.]